MTQVTISYADKSGRVIGQATRVCFGGMGGYAQEQNVEMVGYTPHFQIQTPEQEYLFNWLKTIWDVPKFWPNLNKETFNKGFTFFMNVNQHSLWEMYQYFTLFRYLDPDEYLHNFSEKFKTFADKLVDDNGLNLAQVFVLTNLFGGQFYTGSHALMCRSGQPAGNIEAIVSAETFRSGWDLSKQPVAKKGGGWIGVNKYYSSLLVPNTAKSAHYLSLNKIDDLQLLFPTKWEFVNERLNNK